jgi:thiamine pyrophosphate-dependent acetolactate synthase large subunit-like protein
VARRSNYTYEKRQKEIKKQKKREAKAEKKRLRKVAAEAGLEGYESYDVAQLEAAIERATGSDGEAGADLEDPESDTDRGSP